VLLFSLTSNIVKSNNVLIKESLYPSISNWKSKPSLKLSTLLILKPTALVSVSSDKPTNELPSAKFSEEESNPLT